MTLGHIAATAANAVGPIILLILLGYLLKCIGFFSPEFIRQGNKFVFRVCLPAMLFINVYSIESISSICWDVVAYSVAAVFLLFGLGLLCATAVTRDSRRRGVVMQCVFRSNFAIIGLPLAAALGGSQASAVAAVISAFTIPTFNILAVAALSLFGGQGGKKSVLKGILTNPLILGVAAGLGCLLLRSAQRALFGMLVFSFRRDVPFLYTTVDYLKSIASPLALVVLGGQFAFTAVRGLLKEIAAGVLWRNFLAPLIGIGGAVLLNALGIIHCGSTEYPAMIALFGTPVAVSSAIMAAEMKADEQLAAQLVVWTSIFSVLTVFLAVFVLMATGLLII